MGTQRLLIFGASARAAAFSAMRAGLEPHCADLFMDRDLTARCVAARVPAGAYPSFFLEQARREPPSPWIYLGGLENHPQLVSAIAAQRELWGNPAGSLARARSPIFVSQCLDQAGLPHPRVVEFKARRPPAGRWLVKPLHGTGGAGIFEATDPIGRGSRAGSFYHQEFIDGEPYSAIYVGDGARTRLLGVTRQLVGEVWLHASRFQYCGSVGPVEMTRGARALFEQLGHSLSVGCVLRGLFGVDYMLRDGLPWPLEINPRYTASVEVLEYAVGLNSLAWHREAFKPEASSPKTFSITPGEPIIGKAILFAKERLIFPARGPWMNVLEAPCSIHKVPPFADIPESGEVIEVGSPILTIFASGVSIGECSQRLQRDAAAIDHCLFRG
jgi:predicted ATP-grasp superfamily ATP-dependent carboligase